MIDLKSALIGFFHFTVNDGMSDCLAEGPVPKLASADTTCLRQRPYVIFMQRARIRFLEQHAEYTYFRL